VDADTCPGAAQDLRLGGEDGDDFGGEEERAAGHAELEVDGRAELGEDDVKG
jgi:hypothetical protein